MVAANSIKEYPENLINTGNLNLLRSAAIYGANASGKSNLLTAMRFMQWFVTNSATRMQIDENINVVPFKLDADTENQPSFFEIGFIQNETPFRYGFEVDTKSIVKEWLFYTKGKKEHELFIREADAIDTSDEFKEGKGLETKTRNNALFLPVVAQFNGAIAISILKWFNGFITLYGLQDHTYESFTKHLMQYDHFRDIFIKLIHAADVGIEDIKVKENLTDVNYVSEQSFQSLNNPGKSLEIAAIHSKFKNGNKDGIVNFDFSKEESDGTKKFFRLIGPLLDCLVKGHVVCIDELDAKLHPLLTKAVIDLFHLNTFKDIGKSQLIFTTHDTNLLQYGNLRRDQIWFTEKNRYSASDLYSLAEFKNTEGQKVRNDANFEKNYIQGRYGAIPFLGNFDSIFEEIIHGQTS
jgi:AAA15 family ATPase/GTPase